MTTSSGKATASQDNTSFKEVDDKTLPIIWLHYCDKYEVEKETTDTKPKKSSGTN